jgi:hypothetical protein
MSKWRQKGGGFIGVIKAVTFEKKEWESENAKGGEYTTITAKVMVLKDGADDAIEQYLPAGFLYEGQSISKDGKTLVDKNSDDTPIIDGGSDFARMIDTLEEAGFDPKPLEETNYRNFEAIEGLRVEFKNEINKERQIAAGLKKLGAKRNTQPQADGSYIIKGKVVAETAVMEAGKRTAKKGDRKGQAFNQTRLTVVKILDGAGAVSGDDDDTENEPPVKKAKGAKAKVAEPEDDADDSAEDTEDDGPSLKEAIKMLTSILKDEDDAVSVSDLPVLVARRVKDKAERAAMTKTLVDPNFLGEENGWSVKGSGKKMVVELDA